MPSITPTEYGGPISPATLQKLRGDGISDDTIAEHMSQANPSFASQLGKIRSASGGDPAATTAYLNWRFYGDAEYQPAAKEKKGFISRVADRIYQGIVDVEASKEAADKTMLDPKAALADKFNAKTDQFLQTAGSMLKIGTAPASEAVSTVAGGVMEKTGISGAIKAGAEQIAGTELGQDIIGAGQDMAEGFQGMREQSPQLDAAANTFGDVAGGLMGAADVYALGSAEQMARKGLSKGKDAIVSGAKKLDPRQLMKGKSAATDGAAPGLGGAKDRVATVLSEKAAQKEALAKMPKEYQDAVNGGVSEPFVKLINDAAPEEKGVMKQMVDAFEEGSTDMLKANKAKEIGGQTILNRARYIVKARKTVGKMKGEIMKAIKDEPMDMAASYMDEAGQQINSVYDDLVSELDDRFIVVGKNGMLKAASKKVPVDSADLGFYQKVYNALKPNKKGAVERNVEQLDGLMGYIRDQQNLIKQGGAPFSDGVTRFGTRINSKILQNISSKFPQYGQVQKSYAELSRPLEEFTKFIGHKGSLDELSEASLSAGEKGMRIFGNAASRPRDVIMGMEEVAKKFGFQSNVNIERVLRFADEMENYFPTTQTTSLGGRVERGIEKGMGSVAQNFAEKGLVGGAVKTAKESTDVLMGTRSRDQVQYIRRLLEKLDDAGVNVPDGVQQSILTSIPTKK